MKHYNWTTLGMIYNNDLCSALILPSVMEVLAEHTRDIKIPAMLNLQNVSDRLEQHLTELRQSARSKQEFYIGPRYIEAYATLNNPLLQ